MILEYGVEILLLGLALCSYMYLARLRLLIVIYFFAALLFLDIVVKHSSSARFISVIHLLEMLNVLFGIALYPALKKARLSLMVPILIATTIIDTLVWYYASKGWYNLFMYNYFYTLSAPFFYILFYRMLDLKNWRAKVYVGVCVICELFFLFEYFFHDNSQINYVSSAIFYLLQVVFAGLIIGKLAMKESNVPIIREPFFWLCVGRITLSLVELVMVGVHPFLTKNFIEIYQSRFMELLEPVTGLLLAISYSYTFFLCALRSKERISIGFIKQEVINFLKP